MLIATDVARRITISIPKATSVLSGQGVNYLGAKVSTNTAGVDDFVAGFAMVSTPAQESYNPAGNCLPVNPSRACPCANQGLLAVRVKDLVSYNALTVGGRFALDAGEAIPVAGAFVAAFLGAAGNVLTIRSKQRSAAGVYFVTCEVV